MFIRNIRNLALKAFIVYMIPLHKRRISRLKITNKSIFLLNSWEKFHFRSRGYSLNICRIVCLNSASFESVLNVNRCSKYWGWATENFSLQCSLAFLLLAKRLRGEKEMLRKGCCLSNHQFLRDKIILYAWQTLLRTGSGRVNIRALRHAPVQFE